VGKYCWTGAVVVQLHSPFEGPAEAGTFLKIISVPCCAPAFPFGGLRLQWEVFLGGVLTGFAGDVDDSLAWLARRMVDGELWFGARGVSFTSLIVVGGLVGGHWGLEELWWRERLPLQDVTDARPGACLRGGGDWADGGDGDTDDYDARGARLDGGVLSEAGA
jgi:hypothetical protein